MQQLCSKVAFARMMAEEDVGSFWPKTWIVTPADHGTFPPKSEYVDCPRLLYQDRHMLSVS